MLKNLSIWPTLLLVFLAIVVFVIVRKAFLVWRQRREEKYSRQARRLMQLVCEIIDLAYVYSSNPEKFYRKFLEKISASSLDERGIINPDTLLRTGFMPASMRREDAVLWMLLRAGFTTRELMVIYGFKNINSVYVKLSRLRGRLDKRMREELDKRQ